MEEYTGEEYQYVKSILKSDEDIQRRCDELAEMINRDYADKDVVVVGILKGSLFFMTDICKRLKISHQLDFMTLSSYGNSIDVTQSHSSCKVVLDLKSNIEGKHVLIIEDLIDTGHTLKFLTENLLPPRRPASVSICVLLDKFENRKVDIPVKYTGWQITGSDWVVGYGMDLEERLRSLPFVGILNKEKYLASKVQDKKD